MLEAARAYWTGAGKPEGFRFHHISTDEVFGSLGPTGRFTEDTPYDPRSPYSASKAASDHLVRAWHETYGLPVVLTNCSNNYGPFHFPEKLIPVVILNALAGKPIPVYGGGRERARLALCRGSRRRAAAGAGKGRGGAQLQYRRRERAAQHRPGAHDLRHPRRQAARRPRPYAEQITFVTDRPGHDARYAIDPTRIRDELGWRPSVTVEEGLRTHRAMVSRQRGLVARAAGPRRRRGTAGGDGMKLLVFGQHRPGRDASCARLAPEADLPRPRRRPT